MSTGQVGMKRPDQEWPRRGELWQDDTRIRTMGKLVADHLEQRLSCSRWIRVPEGIVLHCSTRHDSGAQRCSAPATAITATHLRFALAAVALYVGLIVAQGVYAVLLRTLAFGGTFA